jgi:DNA-binding NarL/FixJ family response regulator
MRTVTNASPPARTESDSTSPAITVWLIEDDHTFRNMVARVLNAGEGMQCSQRFTNAEDALEALAGGTLPDVILLDVGLPGQNGITAVSTIKTMAPAIPVIMLTAFDDHDKIFRALCAGASGYLLKTSPVERIIEGIQEARRGGAPFTPQVAQKVLKMFSKLEQPKPDYGLTEREKKILELMAKGFIKKEIADQLNLNYHTVDAGLRNIYTKLHVHTRTGAVAKALSERLF